MNKGLIAGVAVCATCVVSPVRSDAQRPVPIRDLGPVVAKTTEPIRYFLGLWQFSNGNVLVDEGVRRRLLLFDTTLIASTVVADTTQSALIRYTVPFLPLIPFAGDSVLFVDGASQTLLMLNSSGRMVRVMALPKASDMRRITATGAGALVVGDTRGRIVYRGLMPAAPGASPSLSVDSAPIVRADFDARRVDTIAVMKTPSGDVMEPMRGADGKVSFRDTYNPITTTDAWTIHADGSIAIVRGHDYHVDWIAPDGTRTSSPKLPFDWRRLTEEDKLRLGDSVRKVHEAFDPGGRGGLTQGEATSAAGRFGIAQDQLRVITNPDGFKTIPITIAIVPPAQMGDYYPPIREGAVKADRDGNLWILPTTSAQSHKGGLVYDIVNRSGALTERVELPAGRQLAGFGQGGAVYLLAGDFKSGFTIERARFRTP